MSCRVAVIGCLRASPGGLPFGFGVRPIHRRFGTFGMGRGGSAGAASETYESADESDALQIQTGITGRPVLRMRRTSAAHPLGNGLVFHLERGVEVGAGAEQLVAREA